MLHPAEYHRNISCIYLHAEETSASGAAASLISASRMVYDVFRYISCTV